jgi:serine/threonine-protein kinase
MKSIVEYGIQIAEGLAHAHRRGIIHRDVKTENMMLTEEGAIKITDFGLAQFFGTSHLTKSGSVVGTTAYMSPEQLRSEEVDHRSDLFSLGIVMYEIATGHLPFRGEHDSAVSYSIVNEEPLPLTAPGVSVPPSLKKVIYRCLEKDRENRYQNAEEIAADLRTIQQEMSGYQPRRASYRRGSRRFWLTASGVLALALVGAYFFLPVKPSSADRRSIAVLPFKNLSAGADNEYFSDGVTEDVIGQLSKIRAVSVISRTSVMHYKESQASIRDIAGELHVTSVLEGSVRLEGTKVHIVARLVDARADNVLWMEEYHENLTQIFAIQGDVAKKIARALEAQLSPDERERVEKGTTENLEAYDLYLKGRYHWNRRLPHDLDQAVGYFRQALGKDARYARAFAGLADSYIILGDYNILPPREAYPKAKEAAQKALEMDAEVSEAHISLAYALMHYDRDWPGAEKEFLRAIELAPNSAQAHSWYAHYLSLMERPDDAVREIKQARAMDPLSAVICSDAGLTFYLLRKYDLAIDQLRAALEIDPAFVVANIPLGGAYIEKKMYKEAIGAFEQLSMASAVVTSRANPVPIAALAYVYGVSGRRDDALAYIELLQEKSRDEDVSPYWMAVAFAGVGDVDEEFEWLKKGCEERDGSIIFVRAHPVFDQLHADQRFSALVKSIGLEK